MPKTKTRTRKPSVPVQLPDPLPPLLSRPQIVALTGLSYVSIWKRIRLGTFPAGINVAPKNGRRIRWALDEVVAWLSHEKADQSRRQPCFGKDLKQQQAGGAL